MWLKLLSIKMEKIGETILILIFGLFALWTWIPNKKELKTMTNK